MSFLIVRAYTSCLFAVGKDRGDAGEGGEPGRRKTVYSSQEYSIKLSGTDLSNEVRGVTVIKSKSKTRAKQRKGAVANWKVIIICF
jgi:hypothetical protein